MNEFFSIYYNSYKGKDTLEIVFFDTGTREYKKNASHNIGSNSKLIL